ncbi:class I SAM-dependent methyltransferase [Rubrivirga marina]|uniref:Methyltransferase domain-containing protein n=1 Tax=Rubrivirga marina TaxID=1196024 RepID=A0A271IXT7_9BACT|nr:class I SAM-dependent methyltransferase [Rubrivirga marina]PAP75940.1 hypothetical protein BSZ37_05540 [Rubrivirga marina]
MTSPTYDADYFDELSGFARSSAAAVVPLVRELVRPETVVDVGCGSGAWLAAFAEGGAEVVGVDGPWAEGAAFPGPFVACDLEDEVLALGRRFDLAVSLEVAEYLSEDRAEPFVAALADLADVILFAAAVPGQGGRDHRNEQWPAYWADHFGVHGYLAVDVLRPRIWDRPEVAWWYRQNALLFATEAALDRLPDLRPSVATRGPLALVHPERFQYVLADLQAAREEIRWHQAEAERYQEVVERYREWAGHLQAEGNDAHDRIEELAAWGRQLERDIDRLRRLEPGTVPLRTVLHALPSLAVHALGRRVAEGEGAPH